MIGDAVVVRDTVVEVGTGFANDGRVKSGGDRAVIIVLSAIFELD